MFEWHALGHVPLSASYTQPRLAPDNQTEVWDWFHINSIDLEPDEQPADQLAQHLGRLPGRATASARCSGRSAASHSSFTLGAGRALRLAARRDAPAGRLDRDLRQRGHAGDGAASRAGSTSALDLHEAHRDAAARVRQPGRSVLSPSQGDVQQLANGDQLVGWGQIGLVSEFSPDDALTFQLKLPANVESYRAYRFPWTAQPATPPVVGRGPRGRRRRRPRSRRAGTGRPASPPGRCSPGARRRRSRRSARRSRAPASRPRSTAATHRAVRRRRRRSAPAARCSPPRRRRRPPVASLAGAPAHRVGRTRPAMLAREPMTPHVSSTRSTRSSWRPAVAALLTPLTMRLARRDRRDRPAARARALRPRDAAARRPRDLRRGRGRRRDLAAAHASRGAGILAAAALITLVGALDDRFDFPPWLKLIGQIARGGRSRSPSAAWTSASSRCRSSAAVSFPDAGPTLTAIGLVAMMNVVNFSDGVDGLAAGVCAIVGDRLRGDRLQPRTQTEHAGGVLAAITAGARARLPRPQLPAGVELHGRRRLEPARPADGRDRGRGRPEDLGRRHARAAADPARRAVPRHDVRRAQAAEVPPARSTPPTRSTCTTAWRGSASACARRCCSSTAGR